MTESTILVSSIELGTDPDEADLAAVAFLARYSGRTLDAYRHDLRSFLQWTSEHGVARLAATRAHIELYRMSGQRVVDVGCGPGALTAELVKRLGDDSVVAVDPSAPFVEAVRERHPRVEVHRAGAEQLPLPNDTFDAALAQLVVHFMTDPVAGLRDMSRVVKPGGVVAACVWDFDEGGSPLSLFWTAATDLDAQAPGEDSLPGTRRGHLALLLGEAGVEAIEHAEPSSRSSTDLRGVVATVRTRRWSGRLVRLGAGPAPAETLGGALPRTPPGATVGRDRRSMGSKRPVAAAG